MKTLNWNQNQPRLKPFWPEFIVSCNKHIFNFLAENREKQDREESEKKQNHGDKAISKNKATEALAVLNRDRDESFREQNYSNEAISKEKVI